MKYEARKTALDRVKILFGLARIEFRNNPDLAQKYVDIAKKICMRTRLHIPKEFRIQTCKSCKRFIIPGINSRVRIQPRRKPHLVITCFQCNGKTRIPLDI